ncbi:MAG: hypothetical protein IKQ55_06365 [Kiritimatiellae bacterium]|nr:hypothetical protein [Kiritimatiellia bacterium]
MKPRWPKLLFAAAVAAGTLWACLRVHTYATGQDPKTFLVLAKGILQGRGFAGGSLVAPGWPLVLAGVMKLFGVHAAFWTNMPLFALLVGVVAVLAGNLSGDARRGALVAAGSALLMLGGAPNNPHFLLWAFRQTPVYLAAALALLFLERAAARRAAGRPGVAAAWLAGSLAWVAAGVLLRETGVLLLPAMGLYLLADALGWVGPADGGAGRGRHRWLLAGIFAGVCAAGAAGLAAAWGLGLLPASAQTGYLLELLPHLFGRSSPLPEMAGWIPEELGPAGFAALLLGAALSLRRRNRGYLLLFLVPAASYLLFDGMLKAHRRFFLSTLFFLSPVAMMGACAAASAVWRLLRRALARAGTPEKWRARLRAAGWLAAWAAVAAWGAHVVLAIRPWGVQAGRADVDRALATLAPWAGEGRPLLVDARARFLTDVLDVFTDWPVLAVDRANAASCIREPPLAFVNPANPQAVHWAAAGTPAEWILERWGALVDVPDGDFALGRGKYRLQLAEKWTAHAADHRLPPPPEPGLRPPAPFALLRLAVPPCAADTPLRASFGGHPLAERLEPGFQFLAIPREWLDEPDADGAYTLHIEADATVPADFHPEWCHPDAPLEMYFGAAREPSCVPYLSDEFRRWDALSGLDAEFPYWPAPNRGREFGGDGEIRLPEGVGAAGADYAVRLSLATLHHDEAGRLGVTLSLPEFPDVPPATAWRPYVTDFRTFSFDLGPLPRPPRRLRIHVDRDVAFPESILGNPRHGNVQLAWMEICPRRTLESVRVRVGNSEDGALLGDGFHAREASGTPDHGRWTAARAEVRLPLAGGRDYRLELDWKPMRPRAVPPAFPRISLNGHPLDVQPTDAGLSGRIPAEWLQPANNLLAIETDTWSPADHGSADHRRLGIFLQEIRVSPLPET